MPEDADDIELFWDDVRVAKLRPQETQPQVPQFEAHPGDLVIGTSANRVLVRISPNGVLTFGPEYRPDEAAEVFWEAMGRKRIQLEERLVLFTYMERLIARVGAADLENEQAQLTASRADATDEQRAGAVQAHLRLEAIVHRVIELGRGLVRRPEVPEAAPEPSNEPSS